MKVVILAGGYGTRISEYTKTIPKPMILINNIPILIHIINHYRKYNYNEFYIAVGYFAFSELPPSLLTWLGIIIIFFSAYFIGRKQKTTA